MPTFSSSSLSSDFTIPSPGGSPVHSLQNTLIFEQEIVSKPNPNIDIKPQDQDKIQTEMKQVKPPTPLKNKKSPITSIIPSDPLDNSSKNPLNSNINNSTNPDSKTIDFQPEAQTKINSDISLSLSEGSVIPKHPEKPQLDIYNLFEFVYSGDINSLRDFINNPEFSEFDLNSYGPISLNRDRRSGLSNSVSKPLKSKNRKPKSLVPENSASVSSGNQGDTDNLSESQSGLWTLLQAACYYGRTTIVSMLIESNRIDIEKTDSLHGSTAVGWAAYGGHPNTLSRLISDGNPKIDVTNIHGQTPMDMVPNPESVKWKSLLDINHKPSNKRRKSHKKASSKELLENSKKTKQALAEPNTPSNMVNLKESQSKNQVSDINNVTNGSPFIPEIVEESIVKDSLSKDQTLNPKQTPIPCSTSDHASSSTSTSASSASSPSSNSTISSDSNPASIPTSSATKLPPRVYPSLKWEDLDEGKKKEFFKNNPPEVKAMVDLLETLLFHTDIEGDRVSTSFEELPDFEEYPDYYEVFKDPVSLNVISYRLYNCKYVSFAQFDSEVLRIFHNACYYNVHGSEIYSDALALMSVYCSTRRTVVEKYKIRFDLKIADQKPPRGRYIPRALEGDLDLAVGDCVLVSTAEKKDKMGIILRISVSGPRDRVIILDGMWFVHPSETGIPNYDNSYPHELILNPTLFTGIQAKNVLRRIVILPIKTYLGFYPIGYDKNDIYVCEYTLIPNSQNIIPLTVWPSPSPLQQPVDHYLSFVKYTFPLPIKRVPLDLWDNARYLPNPPPINQPSSNFQTQGNDYGSNSTINNDLLSRSLFIPPTPPSRTGPGRPPSRVINSNIINNQKTPSLVLRPIENSHPLPYMEYSRIPRPAQSSQSPFNSESTNTPQNLNPLFNQQTNRITTNVNRPIQNSFNNRLHAPPNSIYRPLVNPTEPGPHQTLANQNQVINRPHIPPQQNLSNSLKIQHQPVSSYQNPQNLVGNPYLNSSLNSSFSKNIIPQRPHPENKYLNNELEIFKIQGELEFNTQLQLATNGGSNLSSLCEISESGMFCLQLYGILSSTYKTETTVPDFFQSWNLKSLTDHNHSIQVPSNVGRILLRPIYPIASIFQKNNLGLDNFTDGNVFGENFNCSLNLTPIAPYFLDNLDSPKIDSTDLKNGLASNQSNLNSIFMAPSGPFTKANNQDQNISSNDISKKHPCDLLWRKNLLFDVSILPGLNIIKIEFRPPSLWNSMFANISDSQLSKSGTTPKITSPVKVSETTNDSFANTENSKEKDIIGPIIHTIFITRV
ncbi:putative global transcription activator SNF2L2 [Smittium mucronatum]|uniref:Putative global transcription activator SNF2L2 n=1 Tax=Smittium mucronatum TaxID=133383 RepID=A0A1R0GZ87_9FUNG|nr:putative global transcription activator SNF2L2 [Smittium mucronatum]